MWIFILLVISAFCFFLVFLITKGENRHEEERREKVAELIKKNEIQVSKRFDLKLSYTLIHDLQNKCLWCFVRSHLHNAVIKKFNYKDIVQVELKEDDQSIIQTSRSSQLGGALVGGVLGGGVGAMIGGLSGKQKQKRTVSRIQLVFTLDDLENPVYTIVINHFKKPVGINDYQYRKGHEEAFGWLKLCEVIIKRSLKEQDGKFEAEKGEIQNIELIEDDNGNIETNVENHTVADELSKLALLLEKGILTEEEFQNQKKRLLS